MKVASLRAKLKELGLPVSGNKSVLLARLAEATEQQGDNEKPHDARVDDSNSAVSDDDSSAETIDSGGDLEG